MVVLESSRIFSFCFNSKTRSLNALEPTEIIFHPVSINPVLFVFSIVNENWPPFINISEIVSSVNSSTVPFILSSVFVEPTRVFQLLYNHLGLIWEHLKNILSRPVTSNSKGPEHALTRNFPKSILTDMDNRHYISP